MQKPHPADPTSPDNPQHRLNEHRQIITSMLSDREQVGQVLRLAYYRDDEEVQMDEQGLYLLQKYSNSQVAFLGVVGCEEISKNLVLDTVLNLSGSTGNYFTTIYGQPQNNALLLWSLPFSCRPKTKVFILTLTTLQSQHDRRQSILVDLMFLLCSSIAIVDIADLTVRNQRKGRIFGEERMSSVVGDAWMGKFMEEIEKSGKRIITNSTNKRQDPLWPRSVTTFQPGKIPQIHKQTLTTLFPTCESIQTDSPLLNRDQTLEDMLLSLNELQPLINATFLNDVSTFMIEEMRRITVKRYQDLRLSGNILCKLLINSTKYMNKKPFLKVNKIFTSIFKQLYQASILYHSENYTQMLEQQFVSQDPMSYDELLKILQRLQDITMTSFNQNVIHESVHEQYQQQMLDIIEEKQRMLIDVNYKKTRALLASKINALHRSVTFEPQHIRNYLQQLKQLVAQHDHHPIDIVTNKLDKYSNNLQKRIIQERLKVEKEQIAAIKKVMKERKQQFKEVREEHAEQKAMIKQQEKAYKRELREEYKIDVQIKALKKEIDQQKRIQKEYIILKSKQTKKDTAQRLLQTIRSLEEDVRDNAKQMQQINKQFDYHPQILALNKKIEQKQRDIKHLDRLDSVRLSQVTPSVTRTVIQKSTMQKSLEPVPGRKTIKRVTAKGKK